jgi:FkbM family methyltransferase
MSALAPAADAAHAARWAIRLLMGRDPGEEEVAAAAASQPDALALRDALLRSDAHAMGHDRGHPIRGDWGAAPLAPEDVAAVHLLRHGRRAEAAALAEGLARHADAAALRAEFLASPEFAALCAAAGLGEGVAQVTVAGRPIRLRGRAHDGYWAGLAAGALEPGVERLARLVAAALPDGGAGAVLVDAGANIGLTALAMAAAAPRHERLIAIEADARNLPLLRRNLAENGLNGATVLDVAVGAERGRLTFRQAARNGAVGQLVLPETEAAPRPGPKVRVERLDLLLRREGCRRLDLLKLDVEGAEEAALEGAGALPARARTLAFVEFNLWTLMRVANRNPRAVLDGWAQRFPHMVGFTAAGDPWPLPDENERLAFLHSVVVEQQGITDVVLCHDLGWLGRWA